MRNPRSEFGRVVNDQNASAVSLPKLFGYVGSSTTVSLFGYITSNSDIQSGVTLNEILSCFTTGPLAVTELSASQELSNIYLSWTASTGATSYDVYSAASATAAQTFLGNTTETNAVVEDVSAGSTFYYFIYPKNSSGTGDGVYITGYVGSPSALPTLSASDGTYTDEIVLTWEAAEGADTYQVLVASTLEGPQSDLGLVEGTTVTLEGFAQEATYFFFVYPFNSICSGCASGEGRVDTGFTSASGAANKGPVVAISGGDRIVDDTDGDAGEIFSVSATATDSDGEIVSSSWLVGGEVVASGTTANLSLADGENTVTFRATDDDGDSISRSVVITVLAPNIPPVVAISGGSRVITDTDDVAGLVVPFTATATDADGEIVSSAWLVDGEVVASGTVANLALPEGNTRVYFRATDDRGDTTSTNVGILVEARPPDVPPVVKLSVDSIDLTGGSIMYYVVDGSRWGETEKLIAVYARLDDQNGSIWSSSWLIDGEIIEEYDHTNGGGGSIVQIRPVTFGLGTTVLTVQAMDNDGNITSESMNITVVSLSNLAPLISLSGGSGVRVITDTDGAAFEVVSVAATATDADGEIISSSWLVGGEVVGYTEVVSPSRGTLVYSDWLVGGEVVASGTSANLSLADGLNTVTFRATDDDGNITNKSVTISVKAPIVIAPVVSISGGNRSIADTDSAAGETVSFTATATDSDGTIASTQWFVGGSEVATGTSASISLGNGSTVVTFKATDNDGASTSTTATIIVKAPAYTVTDEWPSPYNGVTPDSSLGLAFNNIGVFSASDSIIYTCLRVFTDGLPGSVGGISEFGIGLRVVSLSEATVQITKFREFNTIGALNENAQTPDCSGKFETTTGIYTDIIVAGDSILETTWSLIDPTNLILKLDSFKELTAN